jgi:sortase A
MERALFLIGGALALWCLVVVLRADWYASMPVPPATTTRITLPGEAHRAGRPVSAAPPRGTWLARLEAKSVGLSATVLEGSDEGTLARAAGHIEGTAIPGELGNVAIAGHRETAFRPLRRLQVGDYVTLTTAGRLLRYRVSETKIVRPEEVSVLDPVDRPVMTLVTCHPFEFIGRAPHRFIVRADLVMEESRSSSPRKPETLEQK